MTDAGTWPPPVLRRLLEHAQGVVRPRRSLLDQLGGRLDGLSSVLFEATGAGMLAVDRSLRIVRANALLRAMCPIGADLSPGAAAAPLFAASEREQAVDEIRLALAGRSTRPGFVTRLADARGGPESVVSAVAVALRDPPRSHDGRPAPVVGALLLLADITRQRQLEAQLAQAQKLQAVGSLAGGIAHDFNNLLTAIQGAAEAIAAREGLDAETLEDVAQIRGSAGRGAALVRQLLAFGRQQMLQPHVLSVNDVIADLSGLLRRLLGSKIRLEVELEQPGRQVRVDPTQLDQVLVNLAVNARDAMPEGGTLTLRSGHLTVYRPQWQGVETVSPGRYVMIEVRDTGLGIAPELLPRIFDPFFTTRRAQGGNGLGLSTVHGIVRQSGGFLGVESEPGHGTAFRIYLPRHDGERVSIPDPPQAGAAAPAAPPAGRGTVLLVDDEEPVRRLAERALSRHGWQVLSAETAEAALALLERPETAPIVAIVTDMVMPGMDGAALVTAVRARLNRPRLPALLVSGYAEASLREALAEGQGVLFLAKPYALKQLVDRLSEALAPA